MNTSINCYFNPFVSSKNLQSFSLLDVKAPYQEGKNNLSKVLHFGANYSDENINYQSDAGYVPPSLKTRVGHLVAGLALLIPVINIIVLLALKKIASVDIREMNLPKATTTLHACMIKLASTPKNELEGIFRIEGSKPLLTQWSNFIQIAFEPSTNDILKLFDNEGVTVHDVAKLMTRTINSLPEPIVSEELRQKFIDILDQPEPIDNRSRIRKALDNFKSIEDPKLGKFREVISQLPENQKNIFHLIIQDLHRLSLHSSETKMTAKNLAVCWGPTLLPKKIDLENTVLLDVTKANDVMEFLIKNAPKLI